MFFRIPLDPYLAVVALRFPLLAGPVLAMGRWLSPDEFLVLVRRRPGLWLAFGVLYTILSAVPQGILFRVYFEHRFGALFESRALLLVAGALVFSLGHVVFRNVPALVLTAVGGALFLDTYLRTRSMLLAAAEHGAYGIVAFSAGLGKFLYLGRRPRERLPWPASPWKPPAAPDPGSGV
jgi:membrane protease YdiL (CAAX protease family)